MLDLNNCVVTSVDHSYHDMQTGLKPSKNAERKHFPNRFPPEQEKRWLLRAIVVVWPSSRFEPLEAPEKWSLVYVLVSKPGLNLRSSRKPVPGQRST